MHTRLSSIGLLTLFLLGLGGCESRTSRDLGPWVHVDGGTAAPPSGCASTRICADRLDCEDGERCNTALATPVCQTILCGTVGTACSETVLCTEGLSCLVRACTDPRDTRDPVASCEQGCQRCGRGTEAECAVDCAQFRMDYDSLYVSAAENGCVDPLDGFFRCIAEDPTCGEMTCQAEFDAFVACSN